MLLVNSPGAGEAAIITDVHLLESASATADSMAARLPTLQLAEQSPESRVHIAKDMRPSLLATQRQAFLREQLRSRVLIHLQLRDACGSRARGKVSLRSNQGVL